MTTDIDTLYANRRKRFNDILDGYECRNGDFKIAAPAQPQFADRLVLEGREEELCRPGKWALVEQCEGRYFITNVINERDVASVAAQNVRAGWWPICYFDLDVLAGDEPMPQVGDLICMLDHDQSTPVTGDAAGTWYVVEQHGSEDDGDGVYVKVDLAREIDGEAEAWHTSDFVRVLEPANPDRDDRMPVRYGVAKVVTVVVFNTIASS